MTEYLFLWLWLVVSAVYDIFLKIIVNTYFEL